MKSKIYSIILVAVIVLVVALGVYLLYRPTSGGAALDSFAQCLSRKGFAMYGAYWCPHCQNQKAMFGSSFKYVNYVECTEETAKCSAAGIQGFPMWITPDGQKLEGEQSLQTLSSVSGCTLPR